MMQIDLYLRDIEGDDEILICVKWDKANRVNVESFLSLKLENNKLKVSHENDDFEPVQSFLVDAEEQLA